MWEPRLENNTERIHWVDTAVTVADCSTQTMNETYLLLVTQKNCWDHPQAIEACAVKESMQAQRRKTVVTDLDWLNTEVFERSVQRTAMILESTEQTNIRHL